MSKLNLTESEFEQLKVLSDFLLFDGQSERLAFPRFEECMGLLTKSQQFPLKTIFMEICGQNRKYINFPRLVKAFLEYKRNSSERSLEFKNFFGFLFKEVLKDTKKSVGSDLTSEINFSSAQHKNRECISGLKVLSDSRKNILGLQFEYDDFFKSNFLCPGVSHEKLATKIDMKLNILDSLNHDLDLDEADLRDSITHIFGTYSNKVEFLGFKCTSGKMYYTGKAQLGSPFLIGKFQTKFHYLRLGVNESGITCIKPFFVNVNFSNFNLAYELAEFNEEDLNDEIYEDEVYLEKITCKKQYQMNVLVPTFEDEAFFVRDEEDLSGDDLYDVISCASHGSYFDEIENEEEENEEGNEGNEEPAEMEGVFTSPMDDLHQYVTVNTVLIPEEEETKPKKKTRPDPFDKWDKISPTTLKLDTLLTNDYNLTAFVERYREDIKNEMAYKKNKRESREKKENNFYFKYLNRGSPSRITPVDEEETLMEEEYKKVYQRSEIALRGEIIVEGGQESVWGRATIPLTVCDFDAKWENFSDFLARKVVRFGIHSSIYILKAIEIMKRIEDEFVDDVTPLRTKVRVFEVLTRLLEQRRLKQSFLGDETTSEVRKEVIITPKKEKTFSPSKTIAKKYERNDASVSLNLLKKDMTIVFDKLKEMNSNTNNDDELETFRLLNKKLTVMKKEKAKLVNLKVEELKKNFTDQTGVNLQKIKETFYDKRKTMVNKGKEKIKINRQVTITEYKKKLFNPTSLLEKDLPQEIKIYRGQKITQVEEYTDDIFPPAKKSLCPFDETNSQWVLPEGITTEDMDSWETFDWIRVDKLWRSEDYQVFTKGVEANDIMQGCLGDCYFLSSLAGLCKYPNLVEALFHFKEKALDRCYGVYLRINGIWQLVLVDDFVPCYGGKLSKNFAFSNANGKELWVVLLEKAWAKISGSYAKVIAGSPAEVFDAISNGCTETVTMSPHMKDAVWTKVRAGHQNGFIMTAGTGESLNYKSVDLVPGHAYTLLGVEEVSAHGLLNKLVKLRNPWGTGEWNGDWSDHSNKWTDSSREPLDKDKEDDGVFYMSIEDFLKYFVSLTITKIFPGYNYSSLKFRKAETSRPNVTKITVEKTSKIYFQLHQKNPRFVLKNGSWAELTSAFILLTDDKGNYISSNCGESPTVSIEVELKEGSYYIYSDVNYRLQQLPLHGYALSSYSENSVTMKKEENAGAVELCTKALTNYARTKCEQTKEGDLSVFPFSSYQPLFPFYFVLFQNDSKFEVEVEFSNILTAGKTSLFYPEKDYGGLDKLVKRVQPNTSEIIIITKVSSECMVETSYKVKTLISDEVLEQLTNSEGICEDLSDEGKIVQKYFQYKGGYGLILENKTTKNLRMKLETYNLSYKDKAQKDIIFDLAGNSHKFFSLKVLPNKKNISFSFNFA